MGKMRRFWTLILFLVAAQVAVNIPVWYASGQNLLAHVFLAIISALSLLVFAMLARVNYVDTQASSYVQILLVEFLFTVGEAAVVILISPAGATGVGLAVGLTAVAALFAVAATADLPARSYLLDFLSRRIFRQHLSPGFGLPDSDFGAEDIQRAVRRTYPPAAAGDNESRERDESNQRDKRGDTPSDGLVEDLARATAWAKGLLAAANTASPARGMPAPVGTSVGFVQSRDDGPKLAVIHYFRPRQIFKALLTMPKSVPFAGMSFPMVARPWQPVEHGSPSPTRGSDGHCWVTFGKEGDHYGVVTAAHVIAPKGAATGSEVSANTSRVGTSGSLRESSVIMDAALVEMSDYPRPALIPAPHSKVPGYKPIRLCAGRGPVDGLVLELFGFIGGEFTRNPGGEPELRALMTLNVAGQPGDSGCLVLDREFERGGSIAPYLMYLGVIQLADRQAGRGLFLDQVAYHWHVNFQFKVPPPRYAAAFAHGKVSGPTAQVVEDRGSAIWVSEERARSRAVVRRPAAPTAHEGQREFGQ